MRWFVVKLGGNVLLEPAAAMFLMLILVMVVNFPGKKTFPGIELYRKFKFHSNSLFPVSHFSQSHNELINYSKFQGSHLSHEVNFTGKTTFPGSQLREVNFPGKSTFLGSQLFQEINFTGNSTFSGS